MARILLGVTGSIVAYSAPDVVKALMAKGHEVQAVLTQSGAQFTTPKTLETFSGKKVLSNDSWGFCLIVAMIEQARKAESIAGTIVKKISRVMVCAFA